ncbi:DUF262 domain-containing protein [Aliarcobacter butzleri]|uniref:DUF262 domain-containing protein n=1 Tax=Aliarcobacter butzleri TaxID=28197 RepID=UPI001EDC72B8|nr:DUF262 domain-containing protein [Aliarcobacter butzleri]MCG3691093.1 DUF262 domain-containing protein [Aliarcobacter butzleri]
MSYEIKERIVHELKSRPKLIRELLEMLSNDRLLLKPFFQRKLVWRKEHKVEFIKTILFNYPFPEIYFADAINDPNQLGKVKWVIDGQQRINAIYEYYLGSGDFQNLNEIKKFSELDSEETKNFLDYEISIRELGEVSEEMLRVIFTRINMTEFNLNIMEKLNASYSTTPLFLFSRQCCDENFEFDDYFKNDFNKDEIPIAEKNLMNNFFLNYKVFTGNDIRRMIDLQYVIMLILTIRKGYFHRTNDIWRALDTNELTTETLHNEILPIFVNVVNFINLLDLNSIKFWTTKVNLFTLFVELSRIENFEFLNIEQVKLVLTDLDEKYNIYKENKETSKISNEERSYFNYSLQGVNDKASRIYRGSYLEVLLSKCKQ